MENHRIYWHGLAAGGRHSKPSMHAGDGFHSKFWFLLPALMS